MSKSYCVNIDENGLVELIENDSIMADGIFTFRDAETAIRTAMRKHQKILRKLQVIKDEEFFKRNRINS